MFNHTSGLSWTVIPMAGSDFTLHFSLKVKLCLLTKENYLFLSPLLQDQTGVTV